MMKCCSCSDNLHAYPKLIQSRVPGIYIARDTCCENEATVAHGIDGVVVSCSSTLRGPFILDSLSSAPALAHLASSARSRQDVIQFEANANGGRRPVLLWEPIFDSDQPRLCFQIYLTFSTSYERVSNLNHLLIILRARIGDI